MGLRREAGEGGVGEELVTFARTIPTLDCQKRDSEGKRP